MNNQIFTAESKWVVDTLTAEIRNLQNNGGGEIHGAIISVVNEDGNFIGLNCDLYYNNIIVQSKKFSNDGTVFFIVQEAGDYEIKVEKNSTIFHTELNITYEDIVIKNEKQKIINAYDYVYKNGVEYPEVGVLETINVERRSNSLYISNSTSAIGGGSVMMSFKSVDFSKYKTAYMKARLSGSSSNPSSYYPGSQKLQTEAYAGGKSFPNLYKYKYESSGNGPLSVNVPITTDSVDVSSVTSVGQIYARVDISGPYYATATIELYELYLERY